MLRIWIVPVVFLLLPSVSSAAFSDACASTATSAGGVLLTCPAGDGRALSEIGATVLVSLRQPDGRPVWWVPAQDIHIQPKNGEGFHLLCGVQASRADAAVDANGQTTISGPIAAGGFFGGGLYVVAEGIMIQGNTPCDNPLPLVLVSPDINGDLKVGLIDLVMFAGALTAGAADPRMDFDGDGLIGLQDFALLAVHYRHACSEN